MVRTVKHSQVVEHHFANVRMSSGAYKATVMTAALQATSVAVTLRSGTDKGSNFRGVKHTLNVGATETKPKGPDTAINPGGLAFKGGGR